MGCICAKASRTADDYTDSPRDKGTSRSSGRRLVMPAKKDEEGPEAEENGHDRDGGGRVKSKMRQSNGGAGLSAEDGERKRERHYHRPQADIVPPPNPNPRPGNPPKHTEGEQAAAGWPAWLTAVAGEAIKGWIPRRADSFEKLDKIGQGTYSNVYKARDLDTGKIVALKKVRFDNLEPESVRFMAREIQVLRRLDHPNVVKLEGLVTSRMSCSLYLVFEYMEHDLAGLAASPGIKFTEPQVKCYMQQLLRGLDHCHSCGVLHRDIKGSNLLIDNGGVLKIADFGLATFFHPDQRQPLTSRVVTLWYRPPELLLGATDYGVAVDLWSTGCILAELLAGKPIMPGRTEELLPIFNVHGKVSSIVFENERRDTAIIRYEVEPGEGDQLVGRVRESLHNTQLGDRTLLIEAFRSDSLLFIGNLTPDIDDAVLRKMFEPHGTIERAFVLHNAAGHSKGYGFVEYSLKSQAMAAKMAMGNINMDGRVLRVEWSDCKRIADMFSTVLFVDRIPKEHPNVEGSLRSLFGRYGKVRDCHLAIGLNNSYRGFGFIDFYHSICADIAHEALDGHELEGHSIRVSFANPSKSAQSYKLRFGSQGSSGGFGHTGRGGFPGMMLNSSMRGHMPMPLLGHRFMGPGRSGMLGMGIGMQFGRGPHVGQALIDQGLVGSGAAMLGAGAAAAAGMMGRAPVLNSVPPRRGMAVGGTLAPLPRFPGQGPVPINPATIAQVATAQAKAREEEAKARAEEYHQQQPQQTADNLFKQSEPQYGYQQPYQQQPQQQSTLQPQYQHAGPQTQQPYAQYYAQPAQSYVQSQQQHQPQQGQYSQSSYYQQQPAQQEQAMPSQPYAYAQQYSQQYGQQYAHPGQQQYSQTYNPPAVQNSAQPYQQTAQTQVQTQYAQPAYTDHYVQQQQAQERQPQTNPVAPATNAAGILPSQSQDGTQQQAYTAYYNQQAQQNVPQVATVAAQTSTAVGTSQQSLEAQWAAYYASQAAYQQQASYAQQQQPSLAASATSYHEQPTGTPDVGQKRTADQMEAGSQNQQMAYNYPQQTASYPQQAVAGAGTYQQQQPMPATAYQQHPPAAVPGYQIQTNALPYQQQPTATGYQKPGSAAVSSGYDKHAVPVADGYQQQQPAAVAAAFQPTAQGQHAAPIYDYSKRPRF